MTKRVVLIGHPVAHSLSGAMQQAAFDARGIDARYDLWDRAIIEFPDAIEEIRSDDFLGANVTIPHKERVVPLLDRLTEEAQATGAVNTLTRGRRRWRASCGLRTHSRRLPAHRRVQSAPPPRRGAGQALREECGAHGPAGDALARVDHRVGACQGQGPHQRDLDWPERRRDARPGRDPGPRSSGARSHLQPDATPARRRGGRMHGPRRRDHAAPPGRRSIHAVDGSGRSARCHERRVGQRPRAGTAIRRGRAGRRRSISSDRRLTERLASMPMDGFRFLTAGESHGPTLGVTVEGVPAGLALTAEDLVVDLARRQRGYGRGARQAIETDEAEIMAGVRHGLTLGSPILLLVRNRDWENWGTVMQAAPLTDDEAAALRTATDEGVKRATPVTRLRPGHADLAGALKYGHSGRPRRPRPPPAPPARARAGAR